MSTPPAARLLWIADRYPPLSGGMAVSCHRQTSGLRRRGVRLDVLAITDVGAEVHLHETARDGGSDFHISREAPPGAVAQRLWRHALQQHAIAPYTWIVGFGANRPGHLASTFGAWLGLPSLVMVRGNDFDQDWFDPRAGFLVREALGRATAIGTVAPEMARRIAALLPDKDVRFLPNGVELSQWEPLPDEQRRSKELRAELAADGRRVIGLFGELKYKKQIAAWLSALRAVRLNDKVSLLTVGTLDEPTRQVLSDPALSPPWKHIPFTTREELPSLYAACDFVALPSLYEGMPNVLLEAMASGVVPLVSSAGAMEVVVRDGRTGFVFTPGDRNGMAEAIRRAVSLNVPRRKAMARQARRFVQEHFSVEQELDALWSIVGADRLIGKRSEKTRPSQP